ncbi:MAG: DJ-1/PfpI family protein, partial [Lewinella sp.]|nr:DJ-1/PfpI family protein [Lewinella sp.]
MTKEKQPALYLILGCIALILAACQPAAESTAIAEPPVHLAPAPELAPDRYNVAFLIMNGVYNTELTAPYDIFQHTIFRDSIKAMNTFLVANTLAPVRTFEGLHLLPHFNYLTDSLPPIDILVVPSAEHHLDTDLRDTAMINFVRRTALRARFVTSHCDGAFVLA